MNAVGCIIAVQCYLHSQSANVRIWSVGSSLPCRIVIGWRETERAGKGWALWHTGPGQCGQTRSPYASPARPGPLHVGGASWGGAGPRCRDRVPRMQMNGLASIDCFLPDSTARTMLRDSVARRPRRPRRATLDHSGTRRLYSRGDGSGLGWPRD